MSPIKIIISAKELVDNRNERLSDELDPDYHCLNDENDPPILLIKSLTEREKLIFKHAFNAGYWHGSTFITYELFGDYVDAFTDQQITEEDYAEKLYPQANQS